MKSNILTKLTMATISTFIVTGTAMADIPYGFDNYTVAGGVITDTGTDPDGAGPLDNCQTGFTCQRMEADGQGIVQRQITDTGTGVSYLQTVITEADATGSAATLDFATEAFVFASGNNSNNIGLQQRINDAGMSTVTLIHDGAFQNGGDESDPNSTGDGIVLELDQTISLGAPDFQVFSQTGSNGNVLQEVNQRVSGQGTDTRFTVRQALGNQAPTAPGTLGAATFPGGGVPYLAGEDVKVVWIGQDAPNAQQFGYQQYTNLDTATSASRNGMAPGSMGLNVDNGPWEWEPGIFGAAPAAPPGTPEFP